MKRLLKWWSDKSLYEQVDVLGYVIIALDVVVLVVVAAQGMIIFLS